MERPPINPGRVDWTGENPCIYLREEENGPFTCLASFFRVIDSPYGGGHALLLLADPQGKGGVGLPNVCLTDNPPLARWLKEEFAAHFGVFKGNPVLRDLPIRTGLAMPPSGDAKTSWTERMTTEGLEIALTWSNLQEPFLVQLPKERSATGVHELFSLFVDAQEAEVVVNGARVKGRVFPRDFQGRQSSHAFLAFSETWVRVS
ncbi:MAG: hypothetical protein HY347_08875 [candidate division NC10 bacterium]|nr:hypothetical protein [candidate division NC10 bacterium]